MVDHDVASIWIREKSNEFWRNLAIGGDRQLDLCVPLSRMSFSEFGICGNHRSLAIRPKENIDPLSDGKMNAAILGICKFLHSGLSLYEAPA